MLVIRERMLGSGHADTARSIDKLAEVLKRLGNNLNQPLCWQENLDPERIQ